MLKFLPAILVLLSGFTANAQYILDRFDQPREHVQIPAHPGKSLVKTFDTDPQILALTNRAKNLAQALVTQFKDGLAPLQSPAPGCDSAAPILTYMSALRLDGRSGEALTLGEKCATVVKTTTAEKLEFKLSLSSSAVGDFQFKKGMDYCNQALATEFAQSPDYSAGVLQCANLAMKTEYQDQVAGIISHAWSGDQARLAQGMIELFFLGSTPLAKEDEVLAFMQALLAKGSPRLKSDLHLAYVAHLDRNRYKYNDVIAYLEKNLTEIRGPDAWVGNVYDGFYHQDIDDAYAVAQVIYDAYLPYARKFSWLPTETNTQTYTTIYGSVCSSNTSHGDASSYLTTYESRYLLGVDNVSDALGAAQYFVGQYPGLSDILTYEAFLQTRDGDDTSAAENYFSAHTFCAYYNRSHWGLVNVIRRKKAHAFSDYDSLLAKMKETVSQLPTVESMSTYVLNWDSLDEETRLRMRFALRFWTPHIDFLASTHQKIYVKRGFELLSSAPYMSSIRDERITYSGDNRLWDDVRGLGGTVVIVDVEEMMDGAFGVYNLAGHEVGHQFHHSLPQNLQDCIEKLYAQALAKDLFADPYAKTNSGEYFAQGVGYYMFPPDSPKRFGLNRQWLTDNDKDLDTFLDGITHAKAVSDITCPL